MVAQRPGLNLREAFAPIVTLKRRDDQPLAVRLQVQVSLLGDPKQVQDGTVDYDSRAVSDCLQTLDHAGHYELCYEQDPARGPPNGLPFSGGRRSRALQRKTSPGPQLAGVTVCSARLCLLGCRGQRDRARVGDGGQGGSLQVRGGIFAA